VVLLFLIAFVDYVQIVCNDFIWSTYVGYQSLRLCICIKVFFFDAERAIVIIRSYLLF